MPRELRIKECPGMKQTDPDFKIDDKAAPQRGRQTEKEEKEKEGEKTMETKMLNKEELEQATGGICLPDDATAEDILAAARQTAREWKNTNMSLNTCLDMVSRYFFVPGKTTKEMIQEVIREEFGV